MLGLRERARLDDAHRVADRGGVLLVVRVELARAANDLLVLAGAPSSSTTLTTIVLSPLSETTTPRRSWRRPSSASGFGVRVIGLRVAPASRFGFECLWRSARGRRFFAGFAGASAAGASAAARLARARRPRQQAARRGDFLGHDRFRLLRQARRTGRQPRLRALRPRARRARLVGLGGRLLGSRLLRDRLVGLGGRLLDAGSSASRLLRNGLIGFGDRLLGRDRRSAARLGDLVGSSARGFGLLDDGRGLFIEPPRPRSASFFVPRLLLVCHLALDPLAFAILSCWTVRMRAISRWASLRRVRVLERAGRRLEAQVEELLARVGEALRELVVGQLAQILSQQRDRHLRAHELGLDRQLLPGEAQRLAGERLRDAGQLEHDAARA